MPNTEPRQPDGFETALQAEMQRLRAEANARYQEEMVTNPETAGKPLIGCNPELARWILDYGARAERERYEALAAALRFIADQGIYIDTYNGFQLVEIHGPDWNFERTSVRIDVEEVLAAALTEKSDA
jgi:hypothetical protein